VRDTAHHAHTRSLTIASIAPALNKANSYKGHTRYSRVAAIRRVLRLLHADFGAPRLEHLVTLPTKPRPRPVCATLAERAAIIAAARPHQRLWVLLCSDLAIRSGTAARLTPANFDPARKTVSFVTKFESAQTLPVTPAIAELVALCPQPDVPCVAQLAPTPTQSAHGLNTWWTRTVKRLGLRTGLRPHDLRRATAVRVYAETRDVLLVKALLGHRDAATTWWYLDHDVTPVDAALIDKLSHRKGTIQ